MTWKKTKSNQWRKGNITISIEKDVISAHMINTMGKGTQMWNVLQQVKGYQKSILRLQPYGDDATFSSKKEAIAYAKSYMKKH